MSPTTAASTQELYVVGQKLRFMPASAPLLGRHAEADAGCLARNRRVLLSM